MKDTYYFSHDYNARQDVKIKKLIYKHGMSGYGIFWSIVEDLYNNANALPTDYESIAYELREDVKVVKSVINDFDLFVIDGKEFGSKSIENRLNERKERSKKARESALYRWNKIKQDANALPTQSDSNAIKERKVNKRKESKGDKEIVIPTLKEFGEYAINEKPNLDKESIVLKYKAWVSNGWKDGNDQPIKNWKTKLLNTIPHLKTTTPEPVNRGGSSKTREL